MEVSLRCHNSPRGNGWWNASDVMHRKRAEVCGKLKKCDRVEYFNSKLIKRLRTWTRSRYVFSNFEIPMSFMCSIVMEHFIHLSIYSSIFLPPARFEPESGISIAHHETDKDFGHVHLNFHPVFQIISSKHGYEAFHLQLTQYSGLLPIPKTFDHILGRHSQNAGLVSYQHPKMSISF